MRESPVIDAINAAGGVAALAKAIGVQSQAVSQWRRVPADRVADVSRITGIPAAVLRPDLAKMFGEGAAKSPTKQATAP